MLRNTRVFKNANNQTVVEVFSIEENITMQLDCTDITFYLNEVIGFDEVSSADIAQELMIDAYNGPYNYGKEYFNMISEWKDDWSSINSDNWLSDLPLIMRKKWLS